MCRFSGCKRIAILEALWKLVGLWLSKFALLTGTSKGKALHTTLFKCCMRTDACQSVTMHTHSLPDTTLARLFLQRLPQASGWRLAVNAEQCRTLQIMLSGVAQHSCCSFGVAFLAYV